MATTGRAREGPGEQDGERAVAGGLGAAGGSRNQSPRPARRELSGPAAAGVGPGAIRRRDPSACPECGGRTVEEDYEVLCRSCGLVVSERRLERGPEWRYDESETGWGGRRCNGAPERASRNPGWARTRIGTYAERERASSRAVGFHRLERLHNLASDYETEVLNHAIPEVKRICSGLDLRGDTVERACGIFRRARSAGFLSSRRIETVAGASVYVACREHRIPRLPRDVAEVLRLTDDDLAGSTAPVDAMLRAFRSLCQADGVPIRPYPLTALDYVPRFASALDLAGATRRRGRALAAAAIETGATANRAPACVAGASLDLAISASRVDEASHVDVADATGYTVETLRDVRQVLEGSLAVDAVEVARGRPG